MASMYSGVMEGGGEEVAAWLTSPAFESRLFTSFPCTNIIPSAANQVLPSSSFCAFLSCIRWCFSSICSVNTKCYIHQHHPLCCQSGTASSSFCSFLSCFRWCFSSSCCVNTLYYTNRRHPLCTLPPLLSVLVVSLFFVRCKYIAILLCTPVFPQHVLCAADLYGGY